MKRLLILGSEEKAHVREAIDGIEPWLSQRAEVTVDLGMKKAVGAEQYDLAVVFGGDGSVLRAARVMGRNQLPILGVNTGKFGFLTETTLEEAREVIEGVLGGNHRVSERMMLRCRLHRDGKCLVDSIAVNDSVLSRTAFSRLITVDLLVDGELVTTYRADGLIVSSPVGSTAHSLSAGGPIIYPEVKAFVVAPICPHTLTNRPLVLPSQVNIEIGVKEFAEQPALTIDGQLNRRLEASDRVEVEQAEECLKLIRTDRKSFFETLQNKLDWRGQPRYAR
jgi:NAD+ kinase